MKDNNVPVAVRLQNRINKLELKLDCCMVERAGSFYMLCKHCDATIIQVNTPSLGGHTRWCPLKGMDKQVEHYKKLLKEIEVKCG